MQDLEITWPDGTTRFSVTDSPIRLGRSSEAAIALTEGSVSRRHLELVWGGSVWTASDSSTHGTFDAEGRRLAPRWTISSDTIVRLGGVKGVRVEINLAPEQPASSTGNGAGAAAVGGGLFSDNRGTLVTPRPQEQEQERGGAASVFADIEPEVAAGRDLPPEASERRADAAAAELSTPEADQRFAPPGAPLHQGPDLPDEEPMFERQAPVLDDGYSAFGRDNSVFDEPGPLRDFGTPPPLDGGSASQRREPSEASGGGGLLERDPLMDESSAASYGGPVGSAPGPIDLENRDGATPGATGGLPAVRLSPNTTIISDAALRLNLDGQDFSFVPGAEVTVGRDPSCLVRVDERHSLVSRKHLRISHRDGAWWIEDFSSKGTFIDERRIKGPYKAEGAFLVNLGDDDAGTPMRIITAGEHRVSRRFNPLVIGALAAVTLLPLAILAILLLSRSEDATTDPDFASAKRSTVMLFGLDGGQGTGFFVDDNLILTNQHVAVLSPQMLVAVSRQTDEPAEIEYATELVANHPFLDIAVLRVSNRATMTRDGPEISSEPVGTISLPSVTIGDSEDITIGDDVFSTGFPDRLSITSTDDMGDLRLPPVAATSGEAASFTIWPGCSNPDFEAFIPVDSPPGVACSSGGDVDKGVLRATFSSGQGASGSAVFHNNRVVAVVYAGDAEDSNKSLNVSTAAFAEWLDEIIESNP